MTKLTAEEIAALREKLCVAINMKHGAISFFEGELNRCLDALEEAYKEIEELRSPQQ
jgi:hypothetical protein